MTARHSFGVEAEQMRPEQAEIARLTAERDRALGQLETARMQASAVMTGAEAQTATIERMIAERLTLTAERDALAKELAEARADIERVKGLCERTRLALVEAANRALDVEPLAKRVEALRAGTSEIVRTGSYLERKYAQKMLAADDKAAQS